MEKIMTIEFPREKVKEEIIPYTPVLTHAQLVLMAEKYLRNRLRAKIVFRELVTVSKEIPDAIGFNDTYSFLIECKTSKSDFLCDFKKSFRKNPEEGMGMFRFYLCPKDLIKPEEVPENWGLIYTDGQSFKTIKKASAQKYSLRSERKILYSGLRRMEGHGVFHKVYERF